MLYVDHNTRAKDIFRISLGTQTFSTVSDRSRIAVIVKFNVDVSLSKLKESLKQHPFNNVLIISYPK